MKTPFNPWPCGIIFFFVLLFFGLAAFVVIASTHRDTLVSENYYEQEMQFQDRIDAVARARAVGAAIQYDAITGRVRVVLPRSLLAQQPVGRVELYRPAAANLDRQIKLEPDANGLQTLDTAALQPGLWIVRVSWTAGGRDYFLEKKITVSAGHSP
jgi:nitrogen fixation protein FixH